jgi:integrative and conjugative element protein (TIGR02256 family)
MIFSYKDVIALSLSKIVVDKFIDYMKHYRFGIESGGIIIGTLNPAANQIIATDVTEPQKKDRQSTFAFLRSEYGHQEIMNNLWESSGRIKTYLGEWHTHNQNIPKPSCIDKKNWIEISRRKQNSNWLFFTIVGKQDIGVWTISDGKIVKMTCASNLKLQDK